MHAVNSNEFDSRRRHCDGTEWCSVLSKTLHIICMYVVCATLAPLHQSVTVVTEWAPMLYAMHSSIVRSHAMAFLFSVHRLLIALRGRAVIRPYRHVWIC